MMLEREVGIILDFLIDAVPEKKLPKADGVFGFGHVDSRVAEQIVKIFLAGKAEKIIISGGKRETNRVPNGFSSEAEYLNSIIMKYGVLGNILEEMASNTLENVLFGMEAAYQVGFYPRSLILVAMPPLLRRSRATFAKQFPKITTFGSAFPFEKSEWQSQRRIRRILAEIDRLKMYADKGDIAAVPIPMQVMSAYHFVSARLSKYY